MTAEHREKLKLPFDPDNLFDLVSDVKRYPTFLEPITAMRMKYENVVEGVGHLRAEARVRYKFVREQFGTNVYLDRRARRIEVGFVSGPFNELANHWYFSKLDDNSTLVDFWIKYSFKNPVLQVLFDTNRVRAIRYLINAFQSEAERRYESIGDLG